MSDFEQEMRDRTAPIREKNQGPLAKLAELISGIGGGDQRQLEDLYRWSGELKSGYEPDAPYVLGSTPDLEDRLERMMRGKLEGADLDGTPISEWTQEDMGIFIDRILQGADEHYGYSRDRY